MPFEINLEGKAYNTDRLSVAEAVSLEIELGRTWGDLNPGRSATEFQAFARVFLTQDHSADQAAKIAAELPLGEAIKAVSWIDDDLPRLFEDGMPDPKAAAGEPSTTTSSTSPGPPGGGHPTSSDDKRSET